MTNITARKVDPSFELSSPIKHGGEERERWSSDLAYIVTAIGSAVGLGNLVRFPGYVQKFGAGAFFVPYLLAFFLIALPFLILETGLGQHFQGGWLVGMGRLHPSLRSIGFPWAGIITLTFYVPLIMYIARMMAASLYSNDEGGLIFDLPQYNYSLTGAFGWVDEHIFHANPGFPTMFDWSSFGANIFVWVLVWAYAFFGVKISGYISYVTVTAPVIIIIVILIAASLLDGVDWGMQMYLGNWDFSVLYQNPSIWSAATGQIMLSCSICLGFLSAFASYNDKENNIARSSVIICVGNSMYSFIGGIAIFAGLGHLVYRNAHGMVDHQTANIGLTDPHKPEFKSYIDIDSTWPDAQYDFGFSQFFTSKKIRDVTASQPDDTINNESVKQETWYTFSQLRYKHWFSSEFAIECMAIKVQERCLQSCVWVENSSSTGEGEEEEEEEEEEEKEEEEEEEPGFCGSGGDTKVSMAQLFPHIKPVALGLALCFGTYPIVLGSLPGPQFWNFLFFFTLLLLGLDSAYAVMEGVNTFLLDTTFFRRFGRKKVHTWICLIGLSLTSFFACDSGLVLLDTLSEYVDFLLLFLGLVEAIAVGWVYRYGAIASKCGTYATRMFAFAFFVPIFFGSTVGFGLASQPKDQPYATYLGFGLCFLLQAILFPIFFYVASIDGNPKFSYKERLWELFFGNVEHLRNEFNRGCIDNYDENWYFTGIPKYWWTVSLKFVAPFALYILVLIKLTETKACEGVNCMGQEDGTFVNAFGN